MTTYYVDGRAGNDSSGDGSSNRPWKTLNKAHGRVQAGDEVRIRTGTYYEELNIRVRNTTWRADTGHTPVMDGRYHDGLFRNDGTLPPPQAGAGYLPDGSGRGSMLGVNVEGVTVDGLTVQNVAGAAVTVVASNVTIRNCRIDFTYQSAITVNPGGSFIDNVVVENNICTRMSVKWYDPEREGGGPEQVAGCVKMGRTRDGIIRNNVIAYGHGEGINIGKGSYRLLIEGNVVHTCNHVHIYINRSIDTIIRNNLVYHLQEQDFVGADRTVPAGIAIGDERPRNDGEWPHSAGGQIYNNVVVGLGKLFHVRNGTNYDTQLTGCYIGYNTFIGGNKTTDAVAIAGNDKGRPHNSSLFENNLVYGGARISAVNGDISGVTFRNNLWSEQPAAAMRGSGDRIGNPNLRDPAAAIRGTYPNPETNIDPRNYQLTSRSALAISRASDGSRANGLQPPAVRKDFYGANRDTQPDIGAHEFEGAVVGITANFSIGPGQAAGQIPHTVDFTDKSEAARPIVSWAWEFGDGETSTERNPSHTYSAADTYDVTLTVTDDQGNSDSLTRSDLIAVMELGDLVVPDTFRRFVLLGGERQRVITFGVQYPDLRCVLIWNDEPFHILNYADIEDIQRALVQDGTELRWIDPSDQEEPLIEDEEPDAGTEPAGPTVFARR